MGIEPASARRTLGLRTVVSTSAGLTFASSTFLAVVAIGHALPGDSGWLPILLAGILCTAAAAAFSELYGMYPNAAGIRLYAQRAFNEKTGLAVSLTYMSVVTLVVGTEAYVLSNVLANAFPAVGPPVWIFLLLTLATAANYFGARVAGALQDLVTYSVVVTIVGLCVAALHSVQFHIPHAMQTGGAGGVFNAMAIAIFLFVGFEWVTPLAEEVRSFDAIPRGMFLALGLLVVVYALVTITMYAFPLDRLLFGVGSHQEPIPHVRFFARVLGPTGRWVIIAASLCMSLTTFNAGLLSVSRFIQSMAADLVLPRWCGRSSRYNTPDAAILIVYVVAVLVSMLVYLSQRYVLLVNAAAATESFIYATAGACVLALRLKDRDRERPYRMAGGLVPPVLLALVFAALGVGVFVQSGKAEYWGAGVLLGVVFLAWWAYVQVVVMPRKERARAERLAKAQNRRTRRPTSNAATPDSEEAGG